MENSIKNPKISIIIPVFNGEPYLTDAIRSALGQTYKNFEIIVVNDGSTDGGKTREIALSFGNQIRYFEKQNGGVSSALNYAISVSTGNYISWLSHDDLYSPNKIQTQVDAMIDSSYRSEKLIIACKEYLINANGKILRTPHGNRKSVLLKSNKALKRLLLHKNFNGCSLLIPREVFENNVFDEKLRYIQDYTMWVSLCLQGYSFLLLPFPCVYSRIHREQQTKKIPYSTYLNEKHNFNEFLFDQTMKSKESEFVKTSYLYFRSSRIFGKNNKIEALKQICHIDTFLVIEAIFLAFKSIFSRTLRKIYKFFLNAFIR